MRALILTPDRNTRNNDFDGAFRVEAERLQEHLVGEGHEVTWRRVNVSRADRDRRADVAGALRETGQAGPIDFFAFLCHGWLDGIQFGYRRGDVADLAALLAGAAAPRAALALYACSTSAPAEPDGDVDAEEAPADGGGTCGQVLGAGFADALAAALRWCVSTQGRSCQIQLDAHDRSGKDGHCTSNPYVRRFLPDGRPLGRFLIAPGSAAWGAWVRELRDRKGSTLRFRYPFLSEAQIVEELRRRYSARGEGS